MQRLTTVRAIHKALLEQLRDGKGKVLCKVHTLNFSEPFTYQVLEARTVKGVLQVRAINGWEVPLAVYINPLEEHGVKGEGQ